MADSDIEKLSADKLLDSFAKTHFWQGIVLSIVFHILVIGVTSTNYLWRTFIAKGEPPSAQADGGSSTNAPPAATNATGSVGSTTNATPDTPKMTPPKTPTSTNATSNVPKDEQAALMDKYKNTPTVKQISEQAKPDEIPKKPDDLGISVDDTNPF
jgi:hypothetical protein